MGSLVLRCTPPTQSSIPFSCAQLASPANTFCPNKVSFTSHLRIFRVSPEIEIKGEVTCRDLFIELILENGHVVLETAAHQVVFIAQQTVSPFDGAPLPAPGDDVPAKSLGRFGPLDQNIPQCCAGDMKSGQKGIMGKARVGAVNRHHQDLLFIIRSFNHYRT